MGFIRILLAISIIFAHAGKPFGYEIISSKVAIHTFFMISGFYMALILNGKYNLKKHAYRIFITNRFLRIYPVYWLVLFLTVSIISVQCAYGGMCLTIPTTPLEFLQYVVKNVFIFPTLGFFTPSAYVIGEFLVPYTWTLGVELLFYFTAPFLVKRRFVTLIILACISFFIRMMVFRYNAAEAEEFLYLNMWFLPSELLFFIFGICAYKVYERLKHVTFPNFLYRSVLGVSILFTLLFSTLLRIFPGHETLIGWMYYATILLSLPFLFTYTKESKFQTMLGEMSYGVYISHSVIIRLFPLTLFPLSKDIYPFLVILFTLLFVYMIRIWFEQPVNQYRQNLIKRA